MTDARRSYHAELEALEADLLRMGQMAARLTGRAVEALQQGDLPLADGVIAGDDTVDALGAEIETRALRLIALQQPVARDLRLIGTAIKATTDLERVADHAVDIAKVCRKIIYQAHSGALPVDITPLAQAALAMLDKGMQALVRHDDDLARAVVADDDAVDATFKDIRGQLMETMPKDKDRLATLIHTMTVIAALERVADHAVNIAERVHYVETGHMEPLSKQYKDSGRREVLPEGN
jgi:phosphate transport system protein